VPIVQKKLLELAGWMARPSITATQMLDSMVTSSRPTRAEVADVRMRSSMAPTVMLSQETAIGSTRGAVTMMAAVAEQAESIAPYEDWNASRVRRSNKDPAYTLAHSLCVAARELLLDALIVPRCRAARPAWSPRTVLRFRSTALARPQTVRRCGLMWGVQAPRCPATRQPRR